MGDISGDHDLYDYCVDDPVNCTDPEGLKIVSALGKFIAKRVAVGTLVGPYLPGLLDPEVANGDEELIYLRRKMADLESKIEKGGDGLFNACNIRELDQMEEYKKREKELWDKYGARYSSDQMSDFSACCYPNSDEFGKRKKEWQNKEYE